MDPIHLFSAGVQVQPGRVFGPDSPGGVLHRKGILPGVSVKPSALGMDGLIIILVNWHPDFVLDLAGFSGDPTIDIDIPVDDFNFLIGKGNEPFDVILCWIGGILKDNDIPAFGFAELIKTL